ncbi:hypothetical protein LWI28_015350 [Acer negundo]|uniref:glutathione transferase n=1 Tax=Acer negundo TaxID=4023 RepID=A0AAD5JJR9_ACENE|nr:hypothetical protein LWI28_015350 [Acer negundo]
MANQEKQVKLYGTWASPLSQRIEIALKLKGVPFDYNEEDLNNKSPSLLKYNPVHKKISVLVHNDKSVAESLVIFEYIDETWKNNNPILPRDPHERATARFWASFIDNKDFFGGDKIGFVDIVGKIVAFWLQITQEVLGGDFFIPEKFPALFEWIGKLQEIDLVNECRPPREKHLAYVRGIFESLINALK